MANLDYKLREELREELPRIFAETGAILVYATTEPTEALLLRGQTVTLWQGRVTQVGPTAQVYRQPHNLDSARVFSDPPLNELELTKAGAMVTLANGRKLPAEGLLSGMPDGAYRLGFRSDAVTVGAAAPGRLSFPGVVSVTEISGSESFVHVDTGVGTWVCLVAGVHEWEPGDTTDVQLDLAESLRVRPGRRAGRFARPRGNGVRGRACEQFWRSKYHPLRRATPPSPARGGRARTRLGLSA